MKKNKKNQTGVVLLFTVIMMFLLAGIVMVFVTMTIQQVSDAAAGARQAQALQLAETGVSDAMWYAAHTAFRAPGTLGAADRGQGYGWLGDGGSVPSPAVRYTLQDMTGSAPVTIGEYAILSVAPTGETILNPAAAVIGINSFPPVATAYINGRLEIITVGYVPDFARCYPTAGSVSSVAVVKKIKALAQFDEFGRIRLVNWEEVD